MLDFYLSGGAGNTDPNLSIGGARSSQKVNGIVASFLAPDTIAGVSIVDAHGLYLHTGSTDNATLSLSTINGIKRIIFAPYREIAGTVAADVNNVKYGADGTYNLAWTSSYPPQSITITVTASALPAIDTIARLIVTRSSNGLFDDTTPDPDMLAITDYRCLYLRNDGAAPQSAIVLLDGLAQGSAIYVALDPFGVGGVPSVVANENTAPAGAIFTQPTIDKNGLPVTLGTGEQIAIWVRRTTNPALVRSVIGDSFGLSAKVLP